MKKMVKIVLKFTLGAVVCMTFFVCGTEVAKIECNETIEKKSEPAKVAAVTPPKPVEKPVKVSAVTPPKPPGVEFELLGTVNLLNGGRLGEILIVEGVSAVDVEATARQAAKVHGLSETDVYCSRLALKANYSSNTRAAHPGELARCYVASLNGAHFKMFPAAGM